MSLKPKTLDSVSQSLTSSSCGTNGRQCVTRTYALARSLEPSGNVAVVVAVAFQPLGFFAAPHLRVDSFGVRLASCHATPPPRGHLLRLRLGLLPLLPRHVVYRLALLVPLPWLRYWLHHSFPSSSCAFNVTAATSPLLPPSFAWYVLVLLSRLFQTAWGGTRQLVCPIKVRLMIGQAASLLPSIGILKTLRLHARDCYATINRVVSPHFLQKTQHPTEICQRKHLCSTVWDMKCYDRFVQAVASLLDTVRRIVINISALMHRLPLSQTKDISSIILNVCCTNNSEVCFLLSLLEQLSPSGQQKAANFRRLASIPRQGDNSQLRGGAIRWVTRCSSALCTNRDNSKSSRLMIGNTYT